MNKKTTTFIIVGVVALLLAVVVFALNAPTKAPASTSTDTPQQTQTTTPTTNPGAEEQEAAATIVYMDSGFEPSTITVKSGDTVRIENKSSMPLSFNSDDHPSHTKQSELNIGDVPKGGSREFVVTKVGTWGYHNHENSTDTGTIKVE